MIFYGKEHPLFSSYIETQKLKPAFSNDMNTHRSTRVPKNNLEEGNKYFIHPGLPLVDRDVDIEYIFNFEDQATLYRLIENGFTYNIDFKNHIETDYIRYVLEDPRCKKIICHIEKMAKALPKLLDSEIIANKTFYERVGINLKTNTFISKKKGDTINILFTNSYYDWDGSFYLRGGHILTYVFNLLSQKYKNIHLTIRSSIPANYPSIDFLRNHPQIEILDYLSVDKLDEVYKKSDIVVLPSARVHSHSICQAFSYGLPVIGSDGWGNDEFITHEENGFIIKGFNNVSWNDENVGCIENYNNIYTIQPDDPRIQQLYFYLEFLIENPENLDVLKSNCLEICESKYSLLNWENWKI
jgi:glycosyltransferase involved in cell wall biosynthesis